VLNIVHLFSYTGSLGTGKLASNIDTVSSYSSPYHAFCHCLVARNDARFRRSAL